MRENIASFDYDNVPSFNEHYFPLFRRNCFLSGLNIEASAHEKMEWMQDLSHNQEALQVLDRKSEWEARRIAAAFGIENWRRGDSHSVFHGEVGEQKFSWVIYQQEWNSLTLWTQGEESYLFRTGTEGWGAWGNHLDSLASGLYRLGFDDERVLSGLPALTAQEQLKLRLSMPREFWPRKWLDEEGA